VNLAPNNGYTKMIFYLLTFVSLSVWMTLSVIFALIYIATHFLKFIPVPLISLYKTPIQIVSIALFVLTVFISGIVYNENSWQEKLRIEQEKYDLAKKEQDMLNSKLGQESAAKIAAIKDSATQLKRQSDNFAQAMKAKDATVQTIIDSFDKAAKDKYNALSAADKAKADKEMQDAINFQKNCPVVPEIYINKLNNSAQNPPKDGPKK
jgi:hypothetical protein